MIKFILLAIFVASVAFSAQDRVVNTTDLQLKEPNPGANIITLKPPASFSVNYNFVLPTTAGTSGQALITDGSGNTSWIDFPSSGANAQLSNLGTTAVNADIVPGSDGIINLGSASNRYLTTHTQVVNGGASSSLELTADGDVNLVPADGSAVSLFGSTTAVDLRFYDDDVSNYVALRAAGTIASDVSFELPAVDGTTGQVLTTNGAGTLSWSTPASSGANTSLSNLSAVAINTSLIPDTDNTHDLGSFLPGGKSWNRVIANAHYDSQGANGLQLFNANDMIFNVTQAFGPGAFKFINAHIDLNNAGSPVKVINAADPTNPQDYATKNYVDSVSPSISAVAPILYTTGTISLGTVGVANGGTGLTSIISAGNFLYSNGSVYQAGTIAQGSGISVVDTGGTLTISNTGNQAIPTLVTTGTTYAATTSDNIILTTGSISVNLYTASGNSGRQLIVKKTDSSLTNIVTIDPNGTETIDGTTSTTLNTLNESLTFVSDGSGWQIIDRQIDQNCQTYTPNTQGFGTVTNVTVTSCRIGKFAYIFGQITTGAVTASEARIDLGFAGSTGNITPDNTFVPSIINCGTWAAAATASTFVKSVLIEPSVSYMTFGAQAAGTADLTKQNGNAMIANTTKMSFNCKVPISGWSD